jgi:hypothetical protein
MKLAIPLILTVLALAGCAGSGGGSKAQPAHTTTTSPATPATPVLSAPPAPPSATAADLDATARRIFPGSHPAGCGDFTTCPITDRLRTRVEQLSHTPPGQPGPVVQFCRCQNGADSMSVASEVTGSGGIAHVELHYGPTFTSKIDLIIVRGPDAQLLLDDTQCTGRGASTSMYAPTLAACST